MMMMIMIDDDDDGPFFFLQPVISEHGLLTTVGYQLGPKQPAVYALEVSSDSLFYFNINKPVD